MSAYKSATSQRTCGVTNRLGKAAPVTRVTYTRALKITLGALRVAPLSFSRPRPVAPTGSVTSLDIGKKCKAAGISDLHFHDIRGTTVTTLFGAGCSIGEIITITGHTLRRAQEILDKYLARTSQLAESAIAKFENVLETDFAKRPAKQG
jgi:integrase